MVPQRTHDLVVPAGLHQSAGSFLGISGNNPLRLTPSPQPRHFLSLNGVQLLVFPMTRAIAGIVEANMAQAVVGLLGLQCPVAADLIARRRYAIAYFHHLAGGDSTATTLLNAWIPIPSNRHHQTPQLQVERTYGPLHLLNRLFQVLGGLSQPRLIESPEADGTRRLVAVGFLKLLIRTGGSALLTAHRVPIRSIPAWAGKPDALQGGCVLRAAEVVMSARRQAADDARCVEVLEQVFRSKRVWRGGVLPGVARFPALPATENDCLKRSNPPLTHFHGHFRKNLVT